jgi:hypothetical protein
MNVNRHIIIVTVIGVKALEPFQCASILTAINISKQNYKFDCKTTLKQNGLIPSYPSFEHTRVYEKKIERNPCDG